MKMGATFGFVFQSWAGSSIIPLVLPLVPRTLSGAITCLFAQRYMTDGQRCDREPWRSMLHGMPASFPSSICVLMHHFIYLSRV
jgi:hypothetical protein